MIALSEVYGVPTVGNSGNDALSNKILYPTFIRAGSVSGAALAQATLSTLLHFYLSHVTLLSQLDERAATEDFGAAGQCDMCD